MNLAQQIERTWVARAGEHEAIGRKQRQHVAGITSRFQVRREQALGELEPTEFAALRQHLRVADERRVRQRGVDLRGERALPALGNIVQHQRRAPLALHDLLVPRQKGVSISIELNREG